MKVALFFLLLSLALEAQITLEYLQSKPASRARDFMIWQYLHQDDINETAAKEAFTLVQNKNNSKIKKAYAKVVNDEVRYLLACQKRADLLDINDSKCLNSAFSLYKTQKLSRFERQVLLQKDLSRYNKKLLELQNVGLDFSKMILFYNPSYVISYLMTLPKEKLNIHLPYYFIEYLSSAPNFSSFVAKIVTDDSYKNTQYSLIDFELKTKLSSQTYFYLALNALRHDAKKRALEYLELSKKAAKTPHYHDRALFWKYLVTNDYSYLQTLLFSMSINIYTQYAHEKFGEEFVNYFSSVETYPKKSSYNLEDPFDWHTILEQIRSTKKEKLFELVERYRYNNLKPVVRYILEKSYNYQMHGYLSIYDSYLFEESLQDKALIYAIMRQESGYVPSAISRSFALGLMQLMPFLVDTIAKQKGEEIKDYKEMFAPQKNLEYAISHLHWLQKNLHNPLYIAYAYNGGYGFFSRYKKRHDFKNKSYEPFMSMELMKNSETREYGKRVLSNYFMYLTIYHQKASIIDFFENLE